MPSPIAGPDSSPGWVGPIGHALRPVVTKDVEASPRGQTRVLVDCASGGTTTGEGPATLIRRYNGAQQADAFAAFQQDARELAKQGYEPVSQSWAEGQWGAGALLIALVLLFVLVGLLVFTYMLLVKPAGTLTVTFARDGAVVEPSPTLAAFFAPSGHRSFREGLAGPTQRAARCWRRQRRGVRGDAGEAPRRDLTR